MSFNDTSVIAVSAGNQFIKLKNILNATNAAKIKLIVHGFPDEFGFETSTTLKLGHLGPFIFITPFIFGWFFLVFLFLFFF